MERTHVSIESLVDRINHNEIKLPEIQRAYVWKPHQVAHLFDSLYRGYPSGAMLLWRPKQQVVEQELKTSGEDLSPVGTPAYLLDGQQRLTSLHRVYSGHPDANVVFNVEKERFQIQSAATAKDHRWVSVAKVLKASKLGPLRKALLEAVPNLDEDEVEHRIAQVRDIAKYEYYLEILSDALKYEEVAQIFVRVNSGGRALKTVDLAMATLSAEWPGVVAKVEKGIARWAPSWPKIDAAFLVRALAATATTTATLPALRGLTPEELEAGWKRVCFGVEYSLKLLKENVGINTSTLIPSINALVPLVVLLGSQEKKFDEADALIYWLLGAFVTGRYSAAADTKIAQDSIAAKSDEPIRSLYKSAGLVGAPLKIATQQLIGKGAGSPFFLLSYLAARDRDAEDWWYGVKISESSGESSFAIEYHHVHPRTTLTDTYSKAEINDLSNLAFISGRANRKIGGRSPKGYFPELCDDHHDQLSPHLVPIDPTLRTADHYLDFLAARRELLAAEMTSILDKYRPAWVEAEQQVSADQVERSVNLTIMAGPPAGPALVFEATLGTEHFVATAQLGEFERFLRDIRENLASSVQVGPVLASLEPEQDDFRVAVGPFDVVGSIDEWEAVLAREKGDVTQGDTPPEDTPAVTGDRQEFAVADTE